MSVYYERAKNTIENWFEKANDWQKDLFVSIWNGSEDESKLVSKAIKLIDRDCFSVDCDVSINTMLGDSKFTPDVLSMAIENTKTKIAENARKISEKQSKLKNTEVELKNIDVYYEEFVSWADEFDTASLERKKMIICRLFKEIIVGKGYKIEILMDSSYEQFLT